MTDIQHIASAPAPDERFLTAAHEHRVRLWSLTDRALVAELDTVLDFGGQRLALCGSEPTPIVVAGAWERHGICAYAPDGTQLWQRKDLRQPQHLAPAADGALVVAGFDLRPLHVLDAASGETVAQVRAVRRFYDSPFGALGLGEVYEHAVLIDTDTWKVRWKQPIDGYGTLSAAASPDAFAVSASSAISCRDLTGDLLWRWPFPPDVNCPALGFDPATCEWLGILRDVNLTRPDTLVRWSPDGTLTSEHPLDLLIAHAFLPGGQHLVTSDGTVRETHTGTVVWKLAAADAGT